MYKRQTYIIVALLLVVVVHGVYAAKPVADSVTTSAIHRLGFDISQEYVLQTNDFFKGKNAIRKAIDKATALHLKYAFQFAESSYYGQLYPDAYQGVGLAYNTFYDPSELGNPVSVYVFQGSRIKQFSQLLSLNYEWNFGASFGWKHYDKTTNPTNIIVGSNVNAYINFGLLLNWKLSNQWLLATGIGVTHYSNGNTHFPNAGINNVGARIGLTRVFNSAESKKHPYPISSYKKRTVTPHISYDVVVFGATRAKGIVEENYMVPGAFAIIGLNFNPMYNFNKYLKAGLSLDALYDESANIKNHVADRKANGEIRFYRPPLNEQIGIGLSVRGEFVMPIFSINAGIGHNIIYRGDDLNGFYQMAVLKTNITRDLFLHIGYQLIDFQFPRSLMIGLGYRIHNKRRE